MINIDKNNYDGYKCLQKCRENKFPFYDIKIDTIFTVTSVFTLFTSSIIAFGSISYFSSINNLSLTFMVPGTLLAFTFIAIKSIEIICRKYDMKSLKKDFDNIDIKISNKELEKALEKYEEVTPLHEKYEEDFSNKSNKVNKLSNHEKLEVLYKEKEFLERLAINEKYNIPENENNKVKVYK